ncbi:MAG: hypothetical protein QOI13_1623, partial [Paraburkholderia sp.]|nr:hypothetical protein [Paraburkholderia sp.]
EGPFLADFCPDGSGERTPPLFGQGKGFVLALTANAYTVPTWEPESKKPSHEDWAKCLISLVGRE